mgnify:CR=1 FL=1
MISVKVDISGLERRAQMLHSEQVPFATAAALTRTAQDAANELNTVMPRYIDRPTPFTQKAFTQSRATKRDLRAVVFVKDIQAKYLRYQILGGNRAPDKIANKLPSTINLNEFGNIPRGEIAKLIALAKAGKRLTKARGKKLGVSSKLDLFYGDPGNGMPPGIYKRVAQGDRHTLIPLVVFLKKPAHYKPIFPMRAIVQQVVDQKFAINFRTAFAAAIKTAR